ncbi:MAG: hypothetical protein ACKVW3_09010 [Phycisphaerales bacterium]
MRTARVLCVMVGMAASLPAHGQGTFVLLDLDGTADVMSADGKVIAGTIRVGNHDSAYRFSSAFGYQIISPVGSDAEVSDISGDGSVIVGKMASGSAFRWSVSTGFALLPTNGKPAGVSLDGASVAGNTLGSASLPFLWTTTGGVRFLDFNEVTAEIVTGLSGDGRVILGYGKLSGTFRYQGFTWSDARGFQFLPTLTGMPNVFMLPNATNFSGSAIAGMWRASGDFFGNSELFLWRVG